MLKVIALGQIFLTLNPIGMMLLSEPLGMCHVENFLKITIEKDIVHIMLL